MYGTVARMRIKPGTEQQLMEFDRREQARKIPGLIGEYIYRMDADSNVYYLAVVFDSKASYVTNANSPEQDASYQQLRSLLQDDPEWNDGEVISSYQQT